MESCGASGARAEELVSVKRSILDIVVVQQQKRILELEEKLKVSRKEVMCLQREKLERWGDVPASMAGDGHSAPGKKAPVKATPTTLTPKMSMSSVKASTPTMSPPKSANKAIDRKSKSAPIRSPQFHILPRYWTEEEHHKFLEGRKVYGPKNYAAISAMVGTRTPKQVRTHAQKYEMRIVRESAMRSYMGSRRQQIQLQMDQNNAVVPTTPPPQAPQAQTTPPTGCTSSILSEDQSQDFWFDDDVDTLDDEMQNTIEVPDNTRSPIFDLDSFGFEADNITDDTKSEPVEV